MARTRLALGLCRQECDIDSFFSAPEPKHFESIKGDPLYDPKTYMENKIPEVSSDHPCSGPLVTCVGVETILDTVGIQCPILVRATRDWYKAMENRAREI